MRAQVNPLQVASLTTSLAPVAIRSLSKLAEAFSIGDETSSTVSTNQSSTQSSQETSSTNEKSGFGQLYQSLEQKLKSLLKQIPGLGDSDTSLSVSIDAEGKLSLKSDDPAVDTQAAEQWLNDQHQLTELANKTLQAKQDHQWKLGLSVQDASEQLNFRF